MAKRPPVTPKWATITYGNDESAWEEAKQECRRILYGACANERPLLYSELMAEIRAIPWPSGDHSSGQLGALLGQVSLEELDRIEDRPVLSSVVFGSKNRPSNGYWAFLEEDLKIKVPLARRDDFWYGQMKLCFEFYSSFLDRVG